MRRIATALAALTLVLAACTGQADTPKQVSDWTRGYEPCVTEDAPGPCYWDARTMGNGPERIANGEDPGRSFVVEPAGDPAENDDDRVIYIDR